MKKNASVFIWLVAIVAVLAAAYTFYSKNRNIVPAPAPQQAAGAPQRQAAVGGRGDAQKVMAPDFTLKDMDGKDVRLSDYKGKIVLLNFWATWCKYCIQEMPDLSEVNAELEKAGDAVILAIDSQEPKDTVEKFLAKNRINLRVLLDSDGAVTQAYGIQGFPTTFVLNRDGSLYTYVPGATNKDALRRIIDSVRKGEPVK